MDVKTPCLHVGADDRGLGGHPATLPVRVHALVQLGEGEAERAQAGVAILAHVLGGSL